ncbi:MAG: V-type ATPase subunit [Candidatus Omnitrophica bacterium]|nr:V-type ATPase subunit [Candidatus Omnitrophota bacterium]
MRQLTKYAFANAKIRAMLSYLISPSFFSGLLEAEDIYEIREELKKTAYKEVMEKVSGETLDLNILEKELARYDLGIYDRIYLILNTKTEKDFVAILKQRYELEELKVILRIWHKKLNVNPEDYLLGRKVSFDIDFKKIILCQNIEEVILLLEDTPYRKPLLKTREKFKNSALLFYLEVALDIDYYQRLFGCIERFSSVDKNIARKILGIEVDMENISWLIRLRKYYSLGMGEILEWVIPGGEKINKEGLRGMYVSNGLSKVIEGLALGPYLKLKDLADENIYLLENFLYEVLSRQVKKTLAGFPFTIGTVLGYLILKHRETRNLVSLFYAKAYGLKNTEALQLLNIGAQ